jgi:hypothetical protein
MGALWKVRLAQGVDVTCVTVGRPQRPGRYAHKFPELPHNITWDVIDKLRPTAAAVDPAGMSGMHQLTEDRVNAAIAEMTKDPRSPRLQASHP